MTSSPNYQHSRQLCRHAPPEDRHRVDQQRQILRISEAAGRDDDRMRPDRLQPLVDRLGDRGRNAIEVDRIVNDAHAPRVDAEPVAQVIGDATRGRDDEIGSRVCETRHAREQTPVPGPPGRSITVVPLAEQPAPSASEPRPGYPIRRGDCDSRETLQAAPPIRDAAPAQLARLPA